MKSFILLLFSVFSFSLFSQDEPSGDSTLMIPKEFFESKGLVAKSSHPMSNLYRNDSDLSGFVSQVYDIRLVFPSTEIAEKFIKNNIGKISEGSIEYKKEIELPNANNIHIYREPSPISQMYKTMQVAHCQWIIVFTIDNVIIKIFTDGEFTPLSECYTIALEAANHVSKKLGKTIDSKSFSVDTLTNNEDLQSKLAKSKVDLRIPSGFENKILDPSLKNYFDQEFTYPGVDLVLRTLVIPNTRDSVSLEDFYRNSRGATLSIVLNLFKATKNNKNQFYTEITDKEECLKLCNGDFVIRAMSPVNENAISKGYKYCYYVAFYKKGAGSCYAFYFSNDVSNFDINVQLMDMLYTFD